MSLRSTTIVLNVFNERVEYALTVLQDIVERDRLTAEVYQGRSVQRVKAQVLTKEVLHKSPIQSLKFFELSCEEYCHE